MEGAETIELIVNGVADGQIRAGNTINFPGVPLGAFVG